MKLSRQCLNLAATEECLRCECCGRRFRDGQLRREARAIPGKHCEFPRNQLRGLPRVLNGLIYSQKKLTKTEVANGIGVHPDTVGNWLSGRCEPKMSDIVALCKFLNVSADVLLGLVDSTPTPKHNKRR